MVQGLVVLLTLVAPLVAVWLLLVLADWRERRRDAAVARQIALTDAIANELGSIVAPLVEPSLWGPWPVRIAVPLSRPLLVGRIVAIASRVLARVPGQHAIVLTAQDEPPSPASRLVLVPPARPHAA
jgi:hypothetical protein